MTVAATLATAPLMAYHFGRLSLVSLFANLLALPVVAPLMWLGMLAAAAGQLSLEAAALLNALNGYCLAYLAPWRTGAPGCRTRPWMSTSGCRRSPASTPASSRAVRSPPGCAGWAAWTGSVLGPARR